MSVKVLSATMTLCASKWFAVNGQTLVAPYNATRSEFYYYEHSS